MTFERWLIVGEAAVIAGLLVWHHYQVKMIIAGVLSQSGSEFTAAVRRPRPPKPEPTKRTGSLT